MDVKTIVPNQVGLENWYMLYRIKDILLIRFFVYHQFPLPPFLFSNCKTFFFSFLFFF